ncbi:disease resistance protein RLM3-like [Mangifera indica]|uniref:disease resistance protein RLM3-like n=1 Tax=Mangifera indica TaxID=29780 RepID=UPI001CFC18C1|nr:disease resistance protein RLM3-like [Mangifera indica]
MRRTSHHLQQLMASFSSSSITPKLEYDVFLSFHDEETRRNIASHLYEALCQKKIVTFIDDSLHRGEEICPSFLKAIEGSKISVIIFSNWCASSIWCFRELDKIVECKREYDQIVIPVFYKVDPSDVKYQTGHFGEIFFLLEKSLIDHSELYRWRTALTMAANLPGFDSRNWRNDAQLIKEIIEDIMKRLQYTSPKYKLGWRHLSVFFLVVEAISVVLDVYGKSKKNFLLAAFVLSAFGFIITIYAFIRKRNTAAYKQRAERELAWVEVAFSMLELVTLFIQYILAVARAKDSYSPSLFPLVFALLAVVFAFKEKKINNHDQISHSQVPI